MMREERRSQRRNHVHARTTLPKTLPTTRALLLILVILVVRRASPIVALSSGGSTTATIQSRRTAAAALQQEESESWLQQSQPQKKQFRYDPSTAVIATPETLRDLAVENAKRRVGSLRYVRSWRHWSQLSLDTIRYHLSQNLPVAPDEQGFATLWYALGVAADTGRMPSFECPGSRSGYALDFFCRSRLLADFLLDLSENPTLPSNWDDSFRNPLQVGEGKNSCQLMSLGGGPGFDFIAAALIASFQSAAIPGHEMTIDATILDYEEGWEGLVQAMAVAYAIAMPTESHTCSWGGKCDITRPLSDPSNRSVLAKADTTDLFVCQYCVAENANLLEASNFVFFVDLFRKAPVGAVFILTETTPRIWPLFVDLLEQRQQHPELRFMQVGFPRNLGRGKNGPQMLLRKVEQAQEGPVLVCPDQIALCDEFRRKRSLHERKMSKNWERQRRRVPGAK